MFEMAVRVAGCTGYGFVDFETAHAAELAVKALQASGIQAQMAKVRLSCCIVCLRLLSALSLKQMSTLAV